MSLVVTSTLGMVKPKDTKAARAEKDSGTSDLQDQSEKMGMAPLEYTRQDFMRPKCSITEFASAHIHKNELAGLKLDREDVTVLWRLNVGKVFPEGDPKRDEIMDQASDLTNSR